VRQSGLLHGRRMPGLQKPPPPQRFWHILQTPYRNRVLVMGLIWTLSYCGIGNVITFWKELALSARGISNAQAGALIASAAVLGMPFTYLRGKAARSHGATQRCGDDSCWGDVGRAGKRIF
jgi:hypothetical protein